VRRSDHSKPVLASGLPRANNRGVLAPREPAPDLDDRVSDAAQSARDLRRLEEFGIRRTFHGFYYISHYYPLRAMTEVTAAEAEEVATSLEGSSFETYIHFPYCEYLCTFCHFYKKPSRSAVAFSAKEDDALGLVEAEMALYHNLLGAPLDARSLQIGGGTQSLISNKRLAQLLENVERHLALRADAEIKIEIYPQDYDPSELREKLKILRDFGFTDIVIDLESGNERTLKYINRPRSSLEAYLRLVEACIEEGHTSIITALMMGLPFETFESLDVTLQTIMSIPEVTVINTFPVIMRETDPISKQYHKNPENFHSAEVRDQMWLFARNTMRANGYTEGPISYQHRPTIRPAQQSDKFECVNLLGFGCSAFGYLNGLDWAAQYYNFCNPDDYRERIERGQLAIWRVGKYGEHERARRKVIFGLANVKTENLFELEDRYGVSVDRLYGKIFNALLRLGLIAVDQEGEGIYYTEEGLSRLEEITYFLSSDFVKDRCDDLPSKQDAHYRELINQHYAVTIPREDRDRFEALAAGQPEEFMWRLRA
jgi:oxygen-independent coproporphyrinogen-3 oxidase